MIKVILTLAPATLLFGAQALADEAAQNMLSSPGAEETSNANDGAPRDGQTAESESSDEVGAIVLPSLRLPWTEPTGEGMSIGIDSGAWGRIWRGGLKIKIPFGRGKVGKAFGMNLRGIGLLFTHYDETEDQDDGMFYLAGRLELYGQSPALLNVIRLYGGGGVQYVHNVSGKKSVGVGAAGYFGFEFFLWRAASFYIEIGGTSGLVYVDDSYAVILAGINIYPFCI